MAEYEVRVQYETNDNGVIVINFDVEDADSMGVIPRGDIVSAVANSVSDVLQALLAQEQSVSNVSVTAKRYFAAIENITLT